jgi:acetyl-CoA carboxylase alpha subunit
MRGLVMKRLTDEQMKRLAEEGTASAMLFLWQEAQRSRQSEAELLDVLEIVATLVAPIDGERAATAREAIRAAIARAEGK